MLQRPAVRTCWEVEQAAEVTNLPKQQQQLQQQQPPFEFQSRSSGTPLLVQVGQVLELQVDVQRW